MSRLLAVQLLSGAIVMGYLVGGMILLRFWRRTQDRLFLIFSAAFFLLSMHRLLLAADTRAAEDQVPFYLMRLLAYVLILGALYDKNRSRSENG
jgi:hypothetical protein